MNCPFCGKPVTGRDLTCPHCGADLRSFDDECPFCGVLIDSSEILSGNCGLTVIFPNKYTLISSFVKHKKHSNIIYII